MVQRGALLGMVLWFAAAPAQAVVPAGTTLLLSHPTLGTLPPGLVNDSALRSGTAVSTTGQFVVFSSNADGLLPAGTTSTHEQVFLRDLQTNATTLISSTPGGAPGNGDSNGATVSGDGTKVALLSEATDLTADSFTGRQLFIRDLSDDTTRLYSRATTAAGAIANASVNDAEISGDGSAVAFVTNASNLSDADTDSTAGVYHRTVVASGNVTSLASRADGAAGASAPSSSQPAISSDGDVVAFVTATDNLGDPDNVDANGVADVFVRDMDTNDTRVASRGSDDEVGATPAGSPALSGTGAVVAFTSSSVLTTVNPDTNDTTDVFRRTNTFGGTAGTTALISQDEPDNATGDGPSSAPQISTNGGVVSFTSAATDLVPDDTNGGDDIFVRTPGAGTTKLLTRTPGGAVAEKSFSSATASISGDGSLVAFSSAADDLTTVDDDDFTGIYAVPAGGETAAEHLSRPTGPPSEPFEGGVNGSSIGGLRSIDAAGRYVVFTSQADAMSTEDDDRFQNVFVADAATGTMILVSRADGAQGAAATGQSQSANISHDGRRVVFGTQASLDLADGNGNWDLYVRDIVANTTRLVSRAPGTDGAAADADVFSGVIDGDGNRVAFSTDATNLGSGEGAGSDVFVRDLDANTTTLVSVADGGSGTLANESASLGDIDAAGNRVSFFTEATNLGPDDPDAALDVYVRDIANARTFLASVPGPEVPASSMFFPGGMSSDGTRVVFSAFGAGGFIYVRDLSAESSVLVSRADGADGAPATGFVSGGGISGDGNRVSFAAPGDLTGEAPAADPQTYVRDIGANDTILISRFDGPAGAPQPHIGFNSSATLSGDGHCAAFTTTPPLAAGAPSADFFSVYLRAIDGECGVIAPAPPATPPVTPPVDGTPAADTTAPVVTNFRAKPKRFPVRGKRRGTKFKFTLSEDASVAIAIARKKAGRKVGKKCVKTTRKNRGRKKCTRYVAKGTLKRSGLKAGSRSVKFSGKLRKKRLARGRYRARIRATDAAGNRSKRRSASFRIVKP